MGQELTNEQKAKLLGWKYKFSESRNEFRWCGPDGMDYLVCPIISEEEFNEKFLNGYGKGIQWSMPVLLLLLACTENESRFPPH